LESMPPLLAVVAIMAGLFLLETGADHLTDVIVALARRWRASEQMVGLLTAGDEWEELIVVVLAIVAGPPGLAVGNVVGSCIANLTGSMPLGFLGRHPLVPDRSARIYAAIMLLVTVLAGIFLIDGRVEPNASAVLIAAFGLGCTRAARTEAAVDPSGGAIAAITPPAGKVSASRGR
jgi:Ca2+/Na+ antiporter